MDVEKIGKMLFLVALSWVGLMLVAAQPSFSTNPSINLSIGTAPESLVNMDGISPRAGSSFLLARKAGNTGTAGNPGTAGTAESPSQAAKRLSDHRNEIRRNWAP